MRVLAFDPGAERMGWACVERQHDQTPFLHGSGVKEFPRKVNDVVKKYQPYKMELIEYWVPEAARLLNTYSPDYVVSEIVPAVGGMNFVAATQSQLAQAAITTVHAIALGANYRVQQIGATTVQANIAVGKKAKVKGKKSKVSKVMVRNGVFEQLPDTRARFKDWVDVFDEPDAIAIGLTSLGFNNVI